MQPLQVFASKLFGREDFHRRRVGTAKVLQIDGDERVALVLQGALVLEAVLNVVEGGVAVAAYHALVADACHGGQRQHDAERLAHPQRLFGAVDPCRFNSLRTR